MTDSRQTDDGRKRVVTTEGNPLGWAVRDSDGDLYVEPDAGVFRGCDSWLSPSWDETATYRLDEDAVVGVGHSTIVLGGTSTRETGEHDAVEVRESESESRSTDRKNAEVNP